MLSFWEGIREKRGRSGGGGDELRCDFEFGERLRFSEAQDMNDLEELIDIHGFFQDGYGTVFENIIKNLAVWVTGDDDDG